MDTKYISKLSLIVLISISIVMVSCSNKASRISDTDKNHKEYYINVCLNNFFAIATDAYIVVNVRNKSTIYPAITTIDCLVSYLIDNSFNHDVSNDFTKTNKLFLSAH